MKYEKVSLYDIIFNNFKFYNNELILRLLLKFKFLTVFNHLKRICGCVCFFTFMILLLFFFSK